MNWDINKYKLQKEINWFVNYESIIKRHLISCNILIAMQNLGSKHFIWVSVAVLNL